MGIKYRISHGDTACPKYTVIYPIQDILRISEVRKGNRGQTMNRYLIIIFDPLAKLEIKDIF